MPFDPISWALGFALSKSAGWLGDKVGAADLYADLEKAVDSWVKDLPDDSWVAPAALFVDRRTIEDQPVDGSGLSEHLAGLPALAQVRAQLLRGIMPTPAEWEEALVERWERKRKLLGTKAQAFFRKSIDEVRPQLAKLAQKLDEVCRKNSQLFQGTVIEYLRQLLVAQQLLLVREGERRRVEYLREVIVPLIDSIGQIHDFYQELLFAFEHDVRALPLKRESFYYDTRVFTPEGQAGLASLKAAFQEIREATQSQRAQIREHAAETLQASTHPEERRVLLLAIYFLIGENAFPPDDPLIDEHVERVLEEGGTRTLPSPLHQVQLRNERSEDVDEILRDVAWARTELSRRYSNVRVQLQIAKRVVLRPNPQ